MKWIKKFESDLSHSDDYLFLLIDNDGNEHFRDGTWEEGVGIYDSDGNYYPAGVIEDGTVVGDSISGYGVLKLGEEGFVPGLEMAMKRGFNYFEGFPEDDILRESYEFNKLSDSELEDVKNDLIDAIEEIKIELLKDVVYDLKSNKIKFLNVFKNIDIQKTLSDLVVEFGEDIVRELNIEALLRKISQIIILKKRNTRRRIKEEFKNYVKTLDDRIKRQRATFSDDDHFDKIEGEWSILPRKKYESEKYDIQVELLKLQEWVVKNNKRIAIVFEGRDAAGKGSTIKRFVEYLNPRYFRVVALGIPTEEEKNNWFGRYEKHLPKPGEIVFFDRSWYNRSVVEPVLGYCTEEQYIDFMENVVDWEESLIKNDLILIKFWFSITKEKQLQRFKIRQESPLKYWKFSPNDAKVVDKFEKIGDFKNEMFQKTSTRLTPWIIVNSNDKKVGRLNAMRYVLDKIDYDGKVPTKDNWYPEVINIII
jgi:polyphosphate kinase 2